MKYYWLKLQRDFFKRHDVRIIEAMQNGKDYLLFYLKLLVESIDHEGALRFSDTVPYNDTMLATITNTNVDIVRTALEAFEQFGMIEILDDETIYMKEVEKMIGTSAQDEHTRESTRMRVTRHREKQKALESRYSNVTCNGEIEKEINIESEKEINTIPADAAQPRPTKHKHGEFQHVLLTDDEVNRLFDDYGEAETTAAIKYLDEYIEMKGCKYKNHNLVLRKWVFDAVKKHSAQKQKVNESSSFWERMNEV